MADLQPGSRHSQRKRRRSPRYEAFAVERSRPLRRQLAGKRLVRDFPDEVKTALAEILIVQLHGYGLRGDQPRRLTRSPLLPIFS
jgi:hypothetical protein